MRRIASVWADLPLRLKALIVISIPIVPLAATGILTLLTDRASRLVVLASTALGLAAAAAAVVLVVGLARHTEERVRRETDKALRRSEQRLGELNAQLERQRAEQDALSRELDSFSYSVSHDLRAPLRHIVGFSTLLGEHLAPTLDDEGRRLLSKVSNAATRLGRLIDDLLVFSRMGRAEMVIRLVDLNTLVEQARAEVLADAGARQIRWSIAQLPKVHGDTSMLRLAFANLLSNAVKYSAPRSDARIEVGVAEETDGEVVIFVSDNGVGFDMKYVDKLFGVFQRLHSSAQFEGTGIGLANVRRIIQRHGGRVWPRSELGRGSTFFIALPHRSTGTPS